MPAPRYFLQFAVVAVACTVCVLITILLQKESFRPVVSCWCNPPERACQDADMTPEVDHLLQSWPRPFWTAHDPSLCVLVSTYKQHGLSLEAMLSSLFASRYPFLEAFLIDTETGAQPLMQYVANRQNKALQREAVHLVDKDGSLSKGLYPNLVKKDWGFILTDLVMMDLWNGTMKRQCDYMMVTNGDNLYSGRLFEGILPEMRKKTDLIGFEFISRYPHGPPAVRTGKVEYAKRKDQMFHMKFKAYWVDKGSVVFRTSTVMGLGKTFILGLIAQDPTLKNTKSEIADGYFYESVAAAEGVTQTIIRRTLFVHQ